MRALLALLVLANLGFFALARGWLEPYVGLSTLHEREPQRLQAQLNAASVRVLDPTAVASLASSCLRSGPFTAEQIDDAEAWLAQAQLPASAWSRTPADAEPASAAAAWWLRVEQADAAQRARLLSLPPIVPGSGFTPCL
ncbi:MAG: hypothetical protein ACRC2B_10850 [Rubrivivax sp.]